MINLDDGLDLDEVLQILRYMHIGEMLKPEVRDRLLGDANGLIAVAQNPLLSGLIGMIPGIREQLDSAVDLVKLAKTVLEVPPR